MSKVLISSLIDQINTLLSRPVGSVSRKPSPDTIHQREQLKQLRSHLEGLTDDSLLGNLEQQYQALVTRLQGQNHPNNDLSNPQSSEQSNQNDLKIQEVKTDKFKTDKLETLPPLLVSPVSNLFGAESYLTKETSTMTNGTPEPTSTFVNDRMIASLQQAIQQTLQQVVKDSVQQSVQQVVSQTLAVERALMVGEISASLNKIVESQQRSQISQELITLNQQKQKLNAEISQLESDRATWMRQFQEFQTTQQEALDRSLSSVNNYVRDQISDSLQQTVQQTVAGTVADSVNQTVVQTLQDNLANLSTSSSGISNSEPAQEEFVNKVQEQTDRFLLHLDEMFSTTFRSLEQEIQEYQTSIATKLGHIETLEQKGEALINALVNRISQQTPQAPQQSAEVTPSEAPILPELPDDIPIRYLETFTEPADENLINALLAGNEFGEAIAEVQSPFESPTIEVEINPLEAETDGEDLALLAPNLEDHPESNLDANDTNNTEDSIDLQVSDLESILGASADTLFEEPVTEVQADPLIDLAGFGTSIILDPQSALAARELNPDFDIEAATQIVERFDAPQEQWEENGEGGNDLDLLSLNFPVSEEVSKSSNLIDDPELLQWLEESNNRPNPTTNIADVSPDEDLLSWLGNEALDMAKLPTPKDSQSLINNSSTSELEVFNTSQIASISATNINLDTNGDNPDSIESKIEQFLNNSNSDQADDSEESLILLTNKNIDDSAFPEWEDSLVDDLNSDLERLGSGVASDHQIAAKLDQFIRNTPYALTNWEAEESQAYPTIIEVSAQSSGDKNVNSQPENNELEVPQIIEDSNALFIDRFADSFTDNDEQSEIAVDTVDLQQSPFSTEVNDIPEIFDDEDSLFDIKPEDQVSEIDLTRTSKPSSSATLSNIDEMDAIFAEVIAENAAKYSQTTPFAASDELDELFDKSPKVSKQEISNNPNLNLDDESELDTLLFGFDPTTELEETDTIMQVAPQVGYSKIDFGADTIREPVAFPDTIESIEEQLDTIMQGYAQEEAIDLRDTSDVTGFVEIEEIPTILESPNVTQTEEDDWNIALEKLESKLVQPITTKKDNGLEAESLELSADEFFASLEYDKLNSFADTSEKPTPPKFSDKGSSGSIADFIDLENNAEIEEEELLLNEFADAQGDAPSNVTDNEWDNLLKNLNSFNFNNPLLDDRREQLGLSSVAPISDTSENVFDIDSLVLESRSMALIPAPPEKEVYSLDDTWVLGIDFGSTAIRASLLNADTGRVYALYLDDVDEMPCKIVWTEDHNSLDDPIAKDIRVLTKRSQNVGLETGEVALVHFKQFLKLGLPYRGVSAWQPIIQWSDSRQVSLRWLIAALKNLLEQIQTRANHPKLPDVGLILLKLSGVVFGYPADWSDTYILNVREAILKAGLVNQAEQVMAVDQAIAPVLSLLHDQKISQEITLLIDAGAVTTNLCLTKGLSETKDRSKLYIRSLDYAGVSISQDIVAQLFYPHWQLITNPNRHLCNFDHLSLPEIGTSAPQQRILLQQYLLSSQLGQQMLELADRVKVTFGRDVGIDSWNEELMGQPIVVLRRELENLILQPFIQRLNRELNTILSNAGILGEDVHQVLLLGSTMHIPLLSRWLAQKLPNAKIDPLATSVVANGLAVSPLYPNLQDVARQQYSDYFLLHEICRLNLTKSVNPNQLLQQLQMRGINIKTCRDRILSILQGDLPEGLFPWQEPESSVILEDPTLSSDLFAGRLFELETDGTYQPNVTKFQQLRVYLQAIIGNMSQTLSEPLVFPEIKTMAMSK
ncbi:hypothetical protein [Pseudanabaena minima]|uniref:hypothetical protein n=1 Tax=Pseudanabaena minima TaxID=890415 RepID=UPI003DA97128